MARNFINMENIVFVLWLLGICFLSLTDNGWRYGVGLPCRLFYFTTAFDGKLHYTAGYAPFLFRIIINLQLNEK